MNRDREDYNWLDDPFDDKKAARELQEAGMSSRSKLFVGLGCLAAVVVLIILAAVGIGMLGVLAA